MIPMPAQTHRTILTSSSTSTEFSTILSTSTATVDVTVDNSITQTAVVTVLETPTVVVSVTSTVYLPIGGTTVLKRAETALPAYASPCSGAVRYSSACSCISVLPTTTTLAASTATVTLPTTIWATETNTNTITQDVLVTVPATTTVIAATATVTSVVATQTVTPFYLTISDRYGTFYIYAVANNELGLVTNNPANALRFELASDGTVWAGGRTLVRYPSPGPQYVRLATPNRLNGPLFTQFRCGINNGQTLSCSVANNPANTWATQLFTSNGQTVRFSGAGFFHATPQEYAANPNPFAQFPLAVSECIVTAHCGAGLTCQQGKCRA
jgi:hypothetical protein